MVEEILHRLGCRKQVVNNANSFGRSNNHYSNFLQEKDMQETILEIAWNLESFFETQLISFVLIEVPFLSFRENVRAWLHA